MKTRQRLAILFAAAVLLCGGFRVLETKAEETAADQENRAEYQEETADDASFSEKGSVSGNGAPPPAEDEPDDIPQQEQEKTDDTGEGTDEIQPEEPLSETEREMPEEALRPKAAPKPADEEDFPIPEEPPAFCARIEFRMGYAVIGTFTDFTPDIIQIRPMYSRDGHDWQEGTERNDWHLNNLTTDNEYLLKGLQNQTCFYNADEPMKSYISGKIDRFYVKLRITRRNGLSYETQAAVIERGGVVPVPEDADCMACFSSSIATSEPDPESPYGYLRYGRYQLTILADATDDEVSALLPDTLPVEVQIHIRSDFLAIGVIDCPVTWKPLSLPRLSAGESITISDAAEEILIPAGTLISTPVGIFRLDEPLSLDSPPSTDEVRLVLNVCSEEENLTGVLKEDRDGLKIALHQKPTGATSIQAYVCTEREAEWTRLSGLSLLEEMGSQPSSSSSGYALLLRNDQEPYQSYLTAKKEGTTPFPFFVGLKIEGGIYDGKELILAWPENYDRLPDLPKFSGGEGNEGNVGSDNRDDGTEGGQRPNLPQIPDGAEEQQTAPDTGQTDESEGQQAAPDTAPKDGPGGQQAAADTDPAGSKTAAPDTAGTASETPVHQSAASADGSALDPLDPQENQSGLGQRPNLPRTAPDEAGTHAASPEDGLNLEPLVVQAAADDKEKEGPPAQPGVKAAEASKSNRRPPLLAAAVGVCIGAAAWKAAGRGRFLWIFRGKKKDVV